MKQLKREGNGRILLINMAGQRFGLLLVLEPCGHSGNRQVVWLCECDCGTRVKVNGSSIRRGDTVSCGAAKHKIKHGLVGTPEYYLWESAKTRAKQQSATFSLNPADIIIPTLCPVLGIPLIKGIGKCSDNSPTLDRLNPGGGYVQDNVRVISHRANSIKRSATIEELERVIAYMKVNGLGLSHEMPARAVRNL